MISDLGFLISDARKVQGATGFASAADCCTSKTLAEPVAHRACPAGRSPNHKSYILNHKSTSRRGILLLVVLALLSLFLFIGTAYVVSTNQFRLASKSYSKVDYQADQVEARERFLDDVLYQLVRDTSNQSSSLRYHSLLRDLYGTDGFTATIPATATATTPLPAWAGQYAGVGNVTAGQMIEFQIPVANLVDLFGNNVDSTKLTRIDNYYNGQVLTYLDGPAEGASTRIVGFYRRVVGAQPAVTDPVVIRVLSSPLTGGQQITNPSVLAGSRIVVNGRPFNGTGVGYDPTAAAGSPRLQAVEQVQLNGSPVPEQIALMPNTVFFEPSQSATTWSVSPVYYGYAANVSSVPLNMRRYDGLGGSDESYDAPDFQNMFLAWTGPSVVNTNWLNVQDNSTSPPGTLGAIVLPSFHRPELINFWANQITQGDVRNSALAAVANVSLLRKIMLRPNWIDHPNFTGSNTYLSGLNSGQMLARMIYGPWDVDNDNDGVYDSVWIDFGAPVMMGPNGKLVKPLAAVMVLDMDGRLNVNAHGTRELAGLGGGLAANPPYDPAGANWDKVPRGQAFGAAEISLEPVVGNRFNDLLNERYSSFGSNDNEPGRKDIYDLSAQLKMQGYPANLPMRSNFGTLPDLRARYKAALNDFGQFVTTWTPQDSAAHSLVEDNPYEEDLSTTGSRGVTSGADSPFSLGELERLLRAYDVDAGSLPDRLYNALNASSNLPVDRTLLTIDSYDLPEPGFQLPEWVNDTSKVGQGRDFYTVMGRQPVNATFADLIEYRLRIGQNPVWNASQDTANPTRATFLRAEMSKLIAPEMMAGLKLDLNRPLGNGRDDNNNGVVDEPGEFADANGNGMVDTNEEGALWYFDRSRMDSSSASNPALNSFENLPTGVYRDEFDRNGDGIIQNAEWGDTDGDNQLSRQELVNLDNYRRQLLARHLYVLALAVVDPFDMTTTDGKAKCRELAQWAINAVEFRDPDNIMTAFEYVEDPFKRGWLLPDGTTPVDGLPNATYPTNDDVQLVWGTERPELVITETLAWHDRRTEDGPGENPDSDEVDSGKKGSTDYDKDKYDRSFDQRERPIGAAFIELFNPAAPSPGANMDTHYVDNSGNDLGINLAAVSESSRTVANNPQRSDRSPVWRLAVYQTRLVKGDTRKIVAGPDKDPDDIDSNNIPSTIDRSVYFAGFDPGYSVSENGVAFYNSLANPNQPFSNPQDNVVLPVRPGRYLVVGAGQEGSAGKYLANFGAKSGSRRSPRGIVLNTRRSAQAANGVELLGADGTTVSDPAGFLVQSLPTPAPGSPEESFVAPIPGDNSPSTADVAIIDRPRRFTITEPAGGYPDRWAGSQWDGQQYGPSYIDIPLDDQRSIVTAGGGIGGGGAAGGGIGAPPNRKPSTSSLVDGETRLSLPGQSTGGGGIGGRGAGAPSDPEQARRTIPGFSWIYLQRLANPLLAWNPLPTLPNGTPNPEYRNDLPVNPYMTVDSMGANVTVFNGLSDAEYLRTNPDADPLKFRNQYAIDTFSSVQRGRANAPADPALRLNALQALAIRTGGRSLKPIDPDNSPNVSQPVANLWNLEGIGITTATRLVTGYFRNRAGTGSGAEPAANSPAKNHNFNGIPDNTLGFLNEPFRNKGADPDKARFVPQQPFPWIDFPNRPYANEGELLQVPMRRASQLLATFSFMNPNSTIPASAKQELYSDSAAGRATEVKLSNSLKWIVDGPYGHLLNFFRTQADPSNKSIAGMYRVLDLVEVPSRFVGTETWLNPAAFGASQVTSTTDPRYQLQPPFNRIPTRRDPGKVNVNTIAAKDRNNSVKAGKAVWDSLFQGNTKRDGSGEPQAHPAADDDDFFLTRKGYWSATTGPGQGSKVDDNTLLNPAYPTLFADPFRPEGTGDLVPLPQMVRTDLDTTLLRSFDGTAGTTPVSQGQPFCSTAALEPFRNSLRNPYFRYSPVSRLSSLTTTRSNVFAVWITIGFFEVEEAPAYNASDPRWGGSIDVYRRVYPDGYTFGKEAGIDTGEQVRLREFAIVDRSIPVGFEPGANHNVRETIRLKRRIE